MKSSELKDQRRKIMNTEAHDFPHGTEVHGDICTAFQAAEAHDQRPSKYRARINEQIWNPGVLESLDFS
jgi:hypothetical protein